MTVGSRINEMKPLMESEEKMKRILLTNDDGINAEGLIALTEYLGGVPDAEVYVFAPAEQQSAKSQSITFRRPVRIGAAAVAGAKEAYAVDGTPADCIKLGLAKLRANDIMPDYVFSGINKGINLGIAAYYSGTIAAAREGVLNGIRSIALSVGSHESIHFDAMLSVVPQIMEIADRSKKGIIISANAPELAPEDIKGIKGVPAAPYGYGEDFVFIEEEADLWQMYPVHVFTDEEMRYDWDWYHKGYVTVSPIAVSTDDERALDIIRKLLISREYPPGLERTK